MPGYRCGHTLGPEENAVETSWTFAAVETFIVLICSSEMLTFGKYVMKGKQALLTAGGPEGSYQCRW